MIGLIYDCSLHKGKFSTYQSLTGFYSLITTFSIYEHKTY